MRGLSTTQEPPNTPPQSRALRDGSPSAPPQLLVIDDDEGTLNFLRQYLECQGFLVATVPTAEEARRHLDAHATDLVVLDIFLADADGLEFLAELKAAHPSLPVIMLTGMGYDDELENEALQHRAAGYVSKLSPLDQLLLAVRRALTTASQEADRRRAS